MGFCWIGASCKLGKSKILILKKKSFHMHTLLFENLRRGKIIQPRAIVSKCPIIIKRAGVFTWKVVVVDLSEN